MAVIEAAALGQDLPLRKQGARPRRRRRRGAGRHCPRAARAERARRRRFSGLVVGWRVHSSVGEFLLAVLLMVFFTYAMAWVGVFLGVVAPTVETVQQLGFLILFP